MKYKTLKHKYMPETFGVFVNQDEGEIGMLLKYTFQLNPNYSVLKQRLIN